MPFDPIVSAPQWDAQGHPYYLTQSGQKSYLTPENALNYPNDPKLTAWATALGANATTGTTGRPAGGFGGPTTWNPQTENWDSSFDINSSLGQLLLAAGFFGGEGIANAAGVGGPASTASAGNAAGAAADTLPSTPIDAGLFTAPSTTASGAVDAALAGGGAGAATGTLPSTAIGNGAGAPAGSNAVPAGSTLTPSTTPSMASPGSSAGLPDWLKNAQDVGQQLSSISAGQAQGRNLDNLANIGFAQAQNNLYNSELKAPQQIAQNSVRGDILSNAKDVSLSAPSDIPVPQISGGLRPSMFSDTTRQLGKNITANAAATPMPTPTPPVLQPMETAGVGSNILNDASMVANLAGPAWKLGNQIPWGQIF